ncbi:sensor histidine kinase [Sphingomicrobium lutaoense]|uniref:histidine kinase n=1 Tax=Sphingomicrobium lutaoense TaxID=515949 RepID=A0A839YVA1_9SPHN|nr:ATP-binding protein [Sphingomicrobium lutaoense]MBB3763139.1 signal transduction histidine kinase [Sphingomicrobium lutaoense]
MKRLSLAAQVALIVAAAILIAQAVNFAIALDNRRGQLVNDAAIPAAQRLVVIADSPAMIDRLEERRRPGRRRVRVGSENPVPDDAMRLPLAERIVADTFANNGVNVRQVVAGSVDGRRGHRTMILVAVQLEDGRWLSARGPGPRPMGPLIVLLAAQSLLIGLIVLIPTLLLLRKVGGSLQRLARRAEAFDGLHAREPMDESGPSDVRRLIAATNAMQERISAMMREKDVMLGAIGHDLRTPLTALRLEAETVEDGERRLALVAQIEELHARFEQILEFARLGSVAGPLEPVEVAPLLAALAEKHDGQVKLGAIEALVVRAQSGPLRRAIENLIDNALRHGGDAELWARGEGGNAIIAVRDHGPGIPPDRRELALQPFGRLDPSRSRQSGGHGLGLAIVAAIARAQGGRLELADPADGAGLEARIVLDRLS